MPGTPEQVAASVDDEQRTAALSWQPPIDDGGDDVSGYRVTLSGEGINRAKNLPPDARSYTFAALPYDVALNLTVHARNTVGLGAGEARAVTLQRPRPGPPLIGEPTAGAAGGAITATARWLPPDYRGTSRISGYQVTALRLGPRGGVVGRTVSEVLPRTARMLEMTLPRVGRYAFTAQAINASGAGQVSARSAVVRGR